MRLWSLQLTVIALAFAVGWAVTSMPTIRVPPAKLKQMCATVKPGDPVGVELCAEIKRQS